MMNDDDDDDEIQPDCIIIITIIFNSKNCFMQLKSERPKAHQTRITKRIQETGAGEGHYQKVERLRI